VRLGLAPSIQLHLHLQSPFTRNNPQLPQRTHAHTCHSPKSDTVARFRRSWNTVLMFYTQVYLNFTRFSFLASYLFTVPHTARVICSCRRWRTAYNRREVIFRSIAG